MIEVLLKHLVDAHETLFFFVLDYLRSYVMVKFILFERFIVKHLLIFKIKLEWSTFSLVLNYLA
jgi:hypothetical protein